jgi:hypothetical protein
LKKADIIVTQGLADASAYFADALKCEHCGLQTVLGKDEYEADAKKKRYWTCGNCGKTIDPDDWQTFQEAAYKRPKPQQVVVKGA